MLLTVVSDAFGATVTTPVSETLMTGLVGFTIKTKLCVLSAPNTVRVVLFSSLAWSGNTALA